MKEAKDRTLETTEHHCEQLKGINGTISCICGMEDNVVQMAILLKPIHEFNTTPTKILLPFWQQADPKSHMAIQGIPKQPNNLEKRPG